MSEPKLISPLLDGFTYGAAMSSNYNSRRYAAETMYTNGEIKIIRERQTFEQLLQNQNAMLPSSVQVGAFASVLMVS